MSIEGFIHHGYHRGLIMSRDTGAPFGEIKLYDIGEETLVGAEYDDRSRQAQPLAWHPGAARALKHHRENEGDTERPTLRKQQSERPTLTGRLRTAEPQPQNIPLRTDVGKRLREALHVNAAEEAAASRPRLMKRPHLKKRT